MAEPIKPYYISFLTDKVPSQIDHTKSSPGPSGSRADRAGYTKIRSRARLTFAWDNGPARGWDGSLLRSVNKSIFLIGRLRGLHL